MSYMQSAFRHFKRAGLLAADAWDRVSNPIRNAAKENHWRPSELAATLTDAAFSLRKVYGKRATRFLFEDRDTVRGDQSSRNESPVRCQLCASYYGDSGQCDEGKPANSPHRLAVADATGTP